MLDVQNPVDPNAIALRTDANALVGFCEPSDKARLLAEAISETMNVSAWGFPIGLVLGAGSVFRARRRPK
ncbi:MAG: hypothetical protein M3020_17100 [Myxococcota bacterium]|jgi:hypothetical protein|nr:hypothetical protein [Myxococcota bacterium]